MTLTNRNFALTPKATTECVPFVSCIPVPSHRQVYRHISFESQIFLFVVQFTAKTGLIIFHTSASYVFNESKT